MAHRPFCVRHQIPTERCVKGKRVLVVDSIFSNPDKCYVSTRHGARQVDYVAGWRSLDLYEKTPCIVQCDDHGIFARQHLNHAVQISYFVAVRALVGDNVGALRGGVYRVRLHLDRDALASRHVGRSGRRKGLVFADETGKSLERELEIWDIIWNDDIFCGRVNINNDIEAFK